MLVHQCSPAPREGSSCGFRVDIFLGEKKRARLSDDTEEGEILPPILCGGSDTVQGTKKKSRLDHVNSGKEKVLEGFQKYTRGSHCREYGSDQYASNGVKISTSDHTLRRHSRCRSRRHFADTQERRSDHVHERRTQDSSHEISSRQFCSGSCSRRHSRHHHDRKHHYRHHHDHYRADCGDCHFKDSRCHSPRIDKSKAFGSEGRYGDSRQSTVEIPDEDDDTNVSGTSSVSHQKTADEVEGTKDETSFSGSELQLDEKLFLENRRRQRQEVLAKYQKKLAKFQESAQGPTLISSNTTTDEVVLLRSPDLRQAVIMSDPVKKDLVAASGDTDHVKDGGLNTLPGVAYALKESVSDTAIDALRHRLVPNPTTPVGDSRSELPVSIEPTLQSAPSPPLSLSGRSDSAAQTLPESPKFKSSKNLSALQQRIQEERRRLQNFIIMQRENEERRRLESKRDDDDEDDYATRESFSRDIRVPSVEAVSDQVFLTQTTYESEMEDDDIDMFADVPVAKKVQVAPCVAAQRLKPPSILPVHPSLSENWDDVDGYYLASVGESLNDGRYTVLASLSGKGVFSSVIKCLDNATKTAVAIKVIRHNDMMRRAAEKEVAILQKLNSSDPSSQKHIVKLHGMFEHRGHYCLVFEWMWGNLRVALKKYALNGWGLTLQAIKSYARQLFHGLLHLRENRILHADLKPDNILLDDQFAVLKICDLGSACEAADNEVTSYLVSRFYRAPEVILGCRYDYGIDTWSAACTLFELATGDVLFPGRSNNDTLKQFIDVKGKIPNKLLRSGQFSSRHFDSNLDFLWIDKDTYTKNDVLRTLRDYRVTRPVTETLLARCPDATGTTPSALAAKGELRRLGDLLDKCLALDPAKRLTPDEALKHPYFIWAKHSQHDDGLSSLVPGSSSLHQASTSTRVS